MEPFSTSVFKVLIWIFATTTKICTRVSFRPPSPVEDFITNSTPFYTSSVFFYERMTVEYKYTMLQRHPFSGLIHSAGELLHTP